MHILINDFIGGALDRGVPLYVRNLIAGLRQEGFQISIVRAPALCRKLPRSLFYLLAVLVEQTMLPVLGFLLRADLTLYPYNSIALADVFSGRGRIVLHDLEQLNRGASFSKFYYLVCYRALKWRNAPIFTISEMSRQRLMQSGLCGHGPVTILPNTFYTFERLVRIVVPRHTRGASILFCTGSTANKDLDTVVADYLPKVLAQGFRVSVLGLHKRRDAKRLASLKSYMASGQLRLCGRLSDREVAREYRSHRIAWVHSLREGFGRCLVEGRLAGARVICTDIPEFAPLRDDDVYVYNDPTGFMAALTKVAHMDAAVGLYQAYPYRQLLRSAIRESFGAVGALREVPQSRPAG